MNPTTTDPSAEPSPADPQLAAALDEAIDAFQSGRQVDRAALLATILTQWES